MPTIPVTILRVSGSREEHHVRDQIVMGWIKRMIGAGLLDTVNLRDGRVMMVDDTGMIDDREINPEATRLYHAVSRPGNPHSIHGDVAIVVDADLA